MRRQNTTAPHPTAHGRGARRVRAGVLALLIASGLIAAVLFPVRTWMEAALHWVAGMGLWAPVVFAAVYVVVGVFSLPGSVVTLAVGATLPLVAAVTTASLGALLGATLTFLVGRFLARDWAAEKMRTQPVFAAIDVAARREGFKIVLLSRLSPVVPFGVINYGYGLTGMPFRTYVLASWIGMIPGTFLYVYLGSLGRAAVHWGNMGLGLRVLYAGGLLATLIVTVLITLIARRALRQAVATDSDEAGADVESNR